MGLGRTAKETLIKLFKELAFRPASKLVRDQGS